MGLNLKFDLMFKVKLTLKFQKIRMKKEKKKRKKISSDSKY